jgi:signal transduction histidine kinase
MFAHDMRGPLANLSLLLEAIADAAETGRREQIARQTARADQILARLEGMLTAMLARMRTLGDPLAPVTGDVDLGDLVETIAGLNRPLAEQRGVRLHCTVVEPLHVRGDAHLLMQAIDNLINNAISFTPAGGRVVCEAGPADNGDTLIRISDEGPGLAIADLGRLFKPFGRASGGNDPARPSHGLGLWIVGLVAERHGGRVEAASDGPGHGATFTVRLPAHRSAD